MGGRGQWRLSVSAVMSKRRSATEMAAVRVRLKAEFVSNLSSPGMALEDMPLSSADRCQWRCLAEGCGHQWPARLQFRTRSVKPSGCPECAKRSNRAPGPGESLAELNPALAQQFRRNLSRPTVAPTPCARSPMTCASGSALKGISGRRRSPIAPMGAAVRTAPGMAAPRSNATSPCSSRPPPGSAWNWITASACPGAVRTASTCTCRSRLRACSSIWTRNGPTAGQEAWNVTPRRRRQHSPPDSTWNASGAAACRPCRCTASPTMRPSRG